jgi:hypothetical protein
LLTNLETTQTKLLQIILVGQPELNRILQSKDLRQVTQRITCRYHLKAFSKFDLTADYIHHRISVSGGDASKLFTRAAIRKIHRLSGGVPRLINLICHRALNDACGKQEKIVDVSRVRQATSEVRPVLVRPWFRKAVYWAPALAAVFVVGIVAGHYLNPFGLSTPSAAPTANQLRTPAGNNTLDQTPAQTTSSGADTDAVNQSTTAATDASSEPSATADTDAVNQSTTAATDASSEPSATADTDAVNQSTTAVADASSEPSATADTDAVNQSTTAVADASNEPSATADTDAVKEATVAAAASDEPSATADIDAAKPSATTAAASDEPSVTADADAVNQSTTAGSDASDKLSATADVDALEKSATSVVEASNESPDLVNTDAAGRSTVSAVSSDVSIGLNETAAPTASEAAADQPMFSELIRDPKLTQDEAFARLLLQWDIQSKPEGSAKVCDMALQKGLRCLFEKSNWHFMRRLNRPVILEFLVKGYQKRYAMLVDLDDHRLTLDLGSRRLTFPLDQVLPYWRGRYILLWKPIYQNMSLLYPGNISWMVRRLRRQLAEIGMPVSTVLDGASIYDEELKRQVLAFQTSRGIKPDGIVGPHTMIHLNTVTNAPDIPMLERGSDKIALTVKPTNP